MLTPAPMRRIITLFLFSTLILHPDLHAQQTPDYFQQRVSYTIHTQLLPSTHTISVAGQMTYVNRSPQSIDTIPMHLWANAYSTRESAYNDQKHRFGSTGLSFAADEELGGYQNLTFSGNPLAQVLNHGPELQTLKLIAPLQPGDSTTIAFRYSLRVPKVFSRMGRTGDLYQLTQWFPKPAVYDQGGWHIMPYLDFGEFYSEFGDYDVTITVPTHGIVAATGQLVNEEGLALRQARINQSTSVDTTQVDALSYGEGTASFHYIARGVHDFAWFVSPAFRVAVDSAQLSAATIPAYAYYSADEALDWQHAPQLLARAAVFADSLIGAYIYPQISAVSAPLGVGGGMEYPMITVIGSTSSLERLDEVLAHEAFHNWFQGMLASNERLHPWMDEGLTTWLEEKYMAHYYPDKGKGELPRFLASGSTIDLDAAMHYFLASAKRAPRPDAAIDSLTFLGYAYAAYTQPGFLFDMLEAYIGSAALEAQLQGYYQNWALKHPQPHDLHRALGGSKVDWLFKDLLLDNKLPDYRLDSVSYTDEEVTLQISNIGEVASPFPIAFERTNGTYTSPIWQAGLEAKTDSTAGETVTVTLPIPDEARRVGIDPTGLTPEIDRNDNYSRITAGLAPKLEPLAVNIISHIGHLDRNDLNVVPTIGYNKADRLMLGVGFHNYVVSTPATRFYLLPMVSTRDASLNGLAGIKHSVYHQHSWWRELQFSAEGKQFHYNYNENYNFNDRFHRGTLEASLFFAAGPSLPLDHRISVRGHFIAQRFAVGRDITTRSFVEETSSYAIAEADYTLIRNHPIKPFDFKVSLQAGEGFSRASAVVNAAIRYQEDANFIRLRAFVGTFLHHNNPAVQAVLLPNGLTGFFNQQYDYTYEEFLVDRSRANGPNQTYVRDGSLTLPFLLAVPFSDSWLTSVTLQADAPLSLIGIKPQAYVDVAVYPDSRSGEDGVVVPLTGGVRVSIFEDLFQLSLPILNNSFVKESTVFNGTDAKYRERITFSLDLTQLNIDELLRRFRG